MEMQTKLKVNRPDYHGGSLVNLMTSIGQAFGREAQDYPGCRSLAGIDLTDYDNLILLVVDGMGYDYVQASTGFYKDHCHASLTSVFPSTTATSITAYLTGQAPQQHGLTGWFTYLKETGGVTAVLPCMLRGSQQSISLQGHDIARLYNHPSFFDELAPGNDRVTSAVVSPNWILDSEFNQCHLGKAVPCGYEGLDEMFAQMANCVKATKDRQYIYAYWPEFDHLSHVHGNQSDPVAEHYLQIQQATEKFLAEVKGTNTLVLITADHGFIDTQPERCITVNDHPVLQSCLRMPLSGEPRAAYCYLHEDKHEVFVDYVNNQFASQLDCVPSQDLLEDNWFGLGVAHPQLENRIGDYTLLMKENFIIKDWLETEKRFFHYGVHGGVSQQEMFIPLIPLPG